MSIREADIDRLASLVSAGGAEELPSGWLSGQVYSLFVEYELRHKREETRVLESRALQARRDYDSVWETLQILAVHEEDLTAPTIPEISPLLQHRFAEADQSLAMTEENLYQHLSEPDVSAADLDAAKRVLTVLLGSLDGIQHHHMTKYENRPIRNERPEVAAVIRGFIRIWCQALNISERDISISSSAGSPAMNFIEAGTSLLLPQPPQRETIERYVIVHRRDSKLNGEGTLN